MTQCGGSVDWDRLADHLGGALTGTPDDAEVARLVATDPAWARAAEQLASALSAVAADLRSLPEPSLPDAIGARLDAALRAAPPPHVGAPVGEPTPAGTDRAVGEPTPAGTDRAGPESAGAATAPVPGQRAAPAPSGKPGGSSRRPPGHPPARARRRRRARWATGVAVATGLVAFAAVGFAALSPSLPLTGADDSGTGREAAPEHSALVEQPGTGADAPVVVASGVDYRSPTIVGAEPELRVVQGTPELGPAERPETSPGGAPEGQDSLAPAPTALNPDRRIPDIVPPTLAALWADPEVRGRCLGLIRAELEPAVIDTVDFARFEGADALVIWATAPDGTRLVWVSGPACGTAGAGPDRIFRTTG